MSDPCKRCGSLPATVFTHKTTNEELRCPICPTCVTNFLHKLLQLGRTTHTELSAWLNKQPMWEPRNWIAGDTCYYCGEILTFKGQEHGKLYFTSRLGPVWLSQDVASRLERTKPQAPE